MDQSVMQVCVCHCTCRKSSTHLKIAPTVMFVFMYSIYELQQGFMRSEVWKHLDNGMQGRRIWNTIFSTAFVVKQNACAYFSAPKYLALGFHLQCVQACSQNFKFHFKIVYWTPESLQNDLAYQVNVLRRPNLCLSPFVSFLSSFFHLDRLDNHINVILFKVHYVCLSND